MVVIKDNNSIIKTEEKDTFSSLEEVVDYFIPKAIKIKPSYMPFGNIGIYSYRDRVFKISFVCNELKACSRIMDFDLKNVVKIFSIRKFLLDKKTHYIIEMEKLNKTTGIYFDAFDIVSLDNSFNSDSKKLLNFITNLLCCYADLKQIKILTPNNKNNKNVLNKFKEIKDVINIYEHFNNIDKTLFYIQNLLNGYLELKSIGIIHNDLHSDNLMVTKSNDCYKIIDFGMITLKQTF